MVMDQAALDRWNDKKKGHSYYQSLLNLGSEKFYTAPVKNTNEEALYIKSGKMIQQSEYLEVH